MKILFTAETSYGTASRAREKIRTAAPTAVIKEITEQQIFRHREERYLPVQRFDLEFLLTLVPRIVGVADNGNRPAPGGSEVDILYAEFAELAAANGCFEQ